MKYNIYIASFSRFVDDGQSRRREYVYHLHEGGYDHHTAKHIARELWLRITDSYLSDDKLVVIKPEGEYPNPDRYVV